MYLTTESKNSADQNSVEIYGDFLSVMFRTALGSTSSLRYRMAVICFIMSAIFLCNESKHVYTNRRFVVPNSQLTPSTWIHLGEAASRSAIHEFPNILWNPKVHYRVNKNPTLLPILSQINQVHTIQSYFSKINFNIIPPLSSKSS
jgi:hypothetical protein